MTLNNYNNSSSKDYIKGNYGDNYYNDDNDDINDNNDDNSHY